MLNKILALAFMCTLALGGITGCITSAPQKDSNTLQESASISFQLAKPAPTIPIKIYIDGQYLGDAQDFQTAKARLDVITGTHLLELKSNDTILLKEKFFVSKGSNKEFTVK